MAVLLLLLTRLDILVNRLFLPIQRMQITFPQYIPHLVFNTLFHAHRIPLIFPSALIGRSGGLVSNPGRLWCGHNIGKNVPRERKDKFLDIDVGNGGAHYCAIEGTVKCTHFIQLQVYLHYFCGVVLLGCLDSKVYVFYFRHCGDC